MPAVSRYTTGPPHHFFGYYGICPWSHDGGLHAALETDFHRRVPTASDDARVGVVDADGCFTQVGSTRAFNLQQGAMLFWLGDTGSASTQRELSYNTWDGDCLIARVVNVDTRVERTLERSLAAISNDGTHAIGLDFGRMYHCRKVVGYANSLSGTIDSTPRDDGLFAVDTVSGDARLLLSVREVADRSVASEGTGHYWFNHVLYRPDDERILFLARALGHGKRLSSLWSVGIGGEDLRCHIPFGHWISHFAWANDRDVLISTDLTGTRRFLWFNTRDNSHEPALSGILPEDGHPAFSPDLRRLVWDTYPGKADRRAGLYVADLERSSSMQLGEFYADPIFDGDIRCDLHPRWDRRGNRITIDSVMEGDRQIYLVEPPAK